MIIDPFWALIGAMVIRRVAYPPEKRTGGDYLGVAIVTVIIVLIINGIYATF